ncbi:MAG: hypothetical protein Kow00108_10420 [Calditrichia bacterium]
MKNFKSFYLILLLILIILVNCSQHIYTNRITVKDNRYDSEFPIRNASTELAQISRSVKKIISTAYYVNYFFNTNDSLTIEDLPKINFSLQPESKIYFTNSASGTATLISKLENRFLFITCAHILNFPDTLVYFKATEDGREGTIINNVAIKIRQSNFIPELGDVAVLAGDTNLDIALVGFVYEKSMTSKNLMIDNFHPLRVPIGNSDQLEWGNFIYLIGFPKGIKMITRAIVSKPEQGSQNKIITDALFNSGSSGAVALAIRDGVPNFELVGIGSSVSAEEHIYLAPEPFIKWDPTANYEGKMFVKKKRLVNYGVTFVVPINEITKFILKNENILERGGYNIFEFKKLMWETSKQEKE